MTIKCMSSMYWFVPGTTPKTEKNIGLTTTNLILIALVTQLAHFDCLTSAYDMRLILMFHLYTYWFCSSCLPVHHKSCLLLLNGMKDIEITCHTNNIKYLLRQCAEQGDLNIMCLCQKQPPSLYWLSLRFKTMSVQDD